MPVGSDGRYYGQAPFPKEAAEVFAKREQDRLEEEYAKAEAKAAKKAPEAAKVQAPAAIVYPATNDKPAVK